MYCLFPWSMPGPAPWSHGICVTRVLLQYVPLISLFPTDMCRLKWLKIKDLTFQHKPFRKIAWTSSLPRAVEVGICKDSRLGLGILSTLTWRAEEENQKEEALHVANTLIVTLILHVCSSCFHACVYQKTFWRLCSGPEPGTYSGKLRIWQSICVCLHTRCICCIRMYFPWSMPGPAPWSHGICVTRVLLQYVPFIKRSRIWHSNTRLFEQMLGHLYCQERWNSAFARTHGEVWEFFQLWLEEQRKKFTKRRTTRGKHTNHHTDFARLLQLLPRMRLPENSSEGSAVDPSQAPTVKNFGSDNPFAYACIRAVFVV